MPRYAAKIDNNQREIVKALRKIPGVSVEVGHDDILVGTKGKTYWYEIKSSNQIDKNGQPYSKALKPSQFRLMNTFKGHYRVVWNIDQILEDIK